MYIIFLCFPDLEKLNKIEGKPKKVERHLESDSDKGRNI